MAVMIFSICSSTIDWSATGTMLQGWGTLLAAAAVLVAARIGANTFDNWRRQKLTERQVEQAEHILTVAYRARRAIDRVRAPVMWAHELNAAEEKLKTDAQWEIQPDKRRQRLITAQGYYNRIEKFRAEWDAIDTCQPTAHALFSEELAKNLETLSRQPWLLHLDVEAYIDDNGSDPEFSKKLRSGMYASNSKDIKDEISERTNATISRIEEILFPILRMEPLRKRDNR
ncbi:hypothetical protein [Emcibacter sp. SYSU 3D8]|uniref:hypothetical protein n=1 Tax=Emcibacter sp. SYSU 3D8 TaxID=3133969 RepID=UPI0031FEF9E4